jgi:hypothetical protein
VHVKFDKPVLPRKFTPDFTAKLVISAFIPGAMVFPISTSVSASWDKGSIITEKIKTIGSHNSFSGASLDISMR